MRDQDFISLTSKEQRRERKNFIIEETCKRKRERHCDIEKKKEKRE